MDTSPNNDAQLLREFAAGQSQSAFRTLVERYQDMVYGTARRRLGNDQAASDVAQNVFAALARKAPWLSSRTSVGGWLYKSTLMEAARRQRDDLRRLKRERLYADEMNIRGTNDHDEEAPQLRELMPVLDDAMSGLSAADREAILLRFFRGLSLRDTGAAMGTTEEAARKRVSRALEKLSGLFKRKGVTIPTAVIAATLLPKAASTAAPIAFAAKATAAASALPAPGLAAVVYMKAAALSKSKVAAICLAGAAVPVSIQAARIASLSAENEALTASLNSRQIVATARPVADNTPAGPGTIAAAGPKAPGSAKPGGPAGKPTGDRREHRSGSKWAELHEMERRFERDARLVALADKLDLDENQLSFISSAMAKADSDRKTLWESFGPGKPRPDKSATTAIETTQDATIDAVLTEDQRTLYAQFRQEERQSRQENYANRLLGEMASLHLSAEQKDRLFPVFAEQMPEYGGDMGPGAWAQTLQEGLVDKLRETLTPDQFRLWQQRADAWNETFRPPPGDKPPGDRQPGDKPADQK